MHADLSEAVLHGIQAGLERQMVYTKDLVKIRPEYILTISVADAIADGFAGFSGYDLEIRLELRTSRVLLEACPPDLAWKSRLGALSAAKLTITRHGKVDIFVKAPSLSCVVELKNVNPQSRELKKEIVRLTQLLLAYGGTGLCSICCIGFPTSIDREAWIRYTVQRNIDENRVAFAVRCSPQIVTGEDPEDGVPAYYSNCITLLRK